MKVTVIGAVNIDITAFLEKDARMHDSNIASVRYSGGGVGHNVAMNCALMGLSPAFISAAGMSLSTDAVLRALSSAGADVSGVARTDAYPTGSYISFIDPSGEMLIAASDMEINSLLTPKLLSGTDLSGGIKAFDANLPEDTIGYIVSLPGIKYAEPVSAAKCTKLIPHLKHIDLIKPNVCEAGVMTGTDIHTEEDIITAGRKLNDMGAGYVCITAGEKGAYLFSGGKVLYGPCFPASPVNSNGAGDAFGAGLIYGVAKGLSPRDTLRVSSVMASIAISGEGAVNTDMNETEVLKKAGIKG